MAMQEGADPMTLIQFPFTSEGGSAALTIETLECTEHEWARKAVESERDWCVCFPEAGSADRLVRAVRILGSDSSRATGPVLRLVGT